MWWQTFDADVRQVRAARRFVADVLRQAGLSSWPADVVVTELAANAVRHARTPFTVAVDTSDRVVVSVTDGSAEHPFFREPPPYAEGGRGLEMVDELTVQWGTRPEADGKTVWAALPRVPATLVADVRGNSGRSTLAPA